MSVELRSFKQSVFNMSMKALIVLIASVLIIFWEEARIPTKLLTNCVGEDIILYQVWRDYQKNAKKL